MPAPQYRSLNQIRKRFPGSRENAHPHLSTLIRWCTRGVRQPDGSRVKLRAIRLGHLWFTTEDWLDDFIRAQSEAHGLRVDGPRGPSEMARCAGAAGAELARMGC